jgi:thioredoxin reductase (NADPH)
VMIEREAPGGQAGSSSRIENYLGFPDSAKRSHPARGGAGAAFRRRNLTPQTVTRIRCNGPHAFSTSSEWRRLVAAR